MKYPNEIVHGFSFEANNPTWKALIMLLDASIEAETADAISKENKGEDRAWHAGRAAALSSFKDILVTTRDDVLADLGRPPQKYESDEIGSDK